MPQVLSVSLGQRHAFSKATCDRIRLIAGEGFEGDANRGSTVQHRSRLRADATQPNLRQVHLIQAELFAELKSRGFEIRPGQLGENITTCGIGLLALPPGTVLQLGETASIEITGLRNPCRQLDKFAPGLQAAVLDRDADGELIRRAGVMATVSQGGLVRGGDPISVRLPGTPHRRLRPI